MSALTPAEQEEFKMLEESEKQARKLEKQRERRAAAKAERIAHEEAVLVKKRAAAAKAREALAEIRAGKRTAQRAIDRAERLKARREAAVKKAAAKVAFEKAFPIPEAPKVVLMEREVRYPTPARVCTAPEPAPRWRLTDGRTTIDISAFVGEPVTIYVNERLTVALNTNPQEE